MKFLILTLVFSVANVHAEVAIPSRLMDGNYSLECWNVRVEEGSNGQLTRKNSREVGSAVVINNRDSQIMKESTIGRSEDVTYSAVGTMTTTYERLGNGEFRTSGRWQGQTTINGYTADEDVSMFRTFRVEPNGIEYNLTIKNNGGSEMVGVGETSVQNLGDGRIIVQNYNREPQKQSSNPKIYQSISTCVYTLVN